MFLAQSTIKDYITADWTDMMMIIKLGNVTVLQLGDSLIAMILVTVLELLDDIKKIMRIFRRKF